MKTRIKITATFALTLALLIMWHFAAVLMNAPNNVEVGLGLFVCAAMFVLGPTGYWLILRRKENENSTTNSIA